VAKRFDTFRQSVDRHGIGPSLFRYAYLLALRFVDFEVCKIAADYGSVLYDWRDVEGYETRVVGQQEFESGLSAELAGADYGFAFKRGDQCVASLYQGSIVGHVFYTHRPTRVRDGLVFTFPSEFVYGYASKTAPSHRGRKLEQDRWKVGRAARLKQTGIDSPIIWYYNVTNLEMMSALARLGKQVRVLGWAAYFKLCGRWFSFRSPRAARVGAGFARSG